MLGYLAIGIVIEAITIVPTSIPNQGYQLLQTSAATSPFELFFWISLIPTTLNGYDIW